MKQLSSHENSEPHHILSLRLQFKGSKKAVHLNHKHILALGLTLVFIISCASVSFASYVEAKNTLAETELAKQELENANTSLTNTVEKEISVYQESYTELQSKAEELEQKISELESVKEELATQLEGLVSEEETASKTRATTEVAPVVASTLTAEPPQSALSIVAKPTSSLVQLVSLKLERIDTQIVETELGFQNVATSVQTLAAYSDIPSGMPVEGALFSTGFNPTGASNIEDGRVHKGLDLSTRSVLKPIIATAAGTVTEVGFDSGYGYYVTIDHGNGYVTKYAHNTENYVAVGDFVKKGDEIALIGSTGQSTGIHCHYEVILNGAYQDPMDFIQ